MRFAAGMGAPLLAAVIWGVFISPKAPHHLVEPWRFGLEILLFALGSMALYLTQRPSLAAALFILFLINRLLVTIWQQ